MAKVREGRGAAGRPPRPTITLSDLEALYEALNRRDYIHPDPLEFVYRFEDSGDREVVGLVAAALSFGRVASIAASVEKVLALLGPRPSSYVRSASDRDVRSACAGFRHRWTTGEELAALLVGVGRAIERHGSLERCLANGLRGDDPSILGALDLFVAEITGDGPRTSLLACPERGSACKRMNLFLRWMARRDRVDPGPWTSVPASKLVVPLDTHMHRISLAWGLTRRATPNLATALEITESFKRFAPDDPVRYDFAITRLGMRSDLGGLSLPPAAVSVMKAATGGRKGKTR